MKSSEIKIIYSKYKTVWCKDNIHAKDGYFGAVCYDINLAFRSLNICRRDYEIAKCVCEAEIVEM